MLILGCESEDEAWEREDAEQEALYAKEEAEEKKAEEAEEKKAQEAKLAGLLKKAEQYTGKWKVDLTATMTAITAKAAYKDTITPNKFERLKKKAEWAFFTKTKDCGGELAIPMENASGREPANEFERRRLMKKVPELKKTLVGQKVRFYGDVSFYEGSKDANGAICANIGGNTKSQLELCRTPYNFKRQQFQFEIRAGANFHWPLSLKSSKPRILTDRMVFKKKYEIGTWGGKKLKLNTFKEDIDYMNGSRFAFSWKVPEAEAEELIKNMRLKVDLVYDVQGLGFHKKCKKSCTVLFGVRECDYDNIGWRPDYGTTFSYQLAKIADFSVKSKGKEVYGVHRMKRATGKAPEASGVVKEINFGVAGIEAGKVGGHADLVYQRLTRDTSYRRVPYTIEGIGSTVRLKHSAFGDTDLRISFINEQSLKGEAQIPVRQNITSYLIR